MNSDMLGFNGEARKGSLDYNDLHIKDADRDQYLHFTSSYLNHTKQAIVYRPYQTNNCLQTMLNKQSFRAKR